MDEKLAEKNLRRIEISVIAAHGGSVRTWPASQTLMAAPIEMTCSKDLGVSLQASPTGIPYCTADDCNTSLAYRCSWSISKTFFESCWVSTGNDSHFLTDRTLVPTNGWGQSTAALGSRAWSGVSAGAPLGGSSTLPGVANMLARDCCLTNGAWVRRLLAGPSGTSPTEEPVGAPDTPEGDVKFSVVVGSWADSGRERSGVKVCWTLAASNCRMVDKSCFTGAKVRRWSTRSWKNGCKNSPGESTLLGTTALGSRRRCKLSAVASMSIPESLIALTSCDRKTDSGMDRVVTTRRNLTSLSALRANSEAPCLVNKPIGTVSGLVPARPRFRDQAEGWMTRWKGWLYTTVSSKWVDGVPWTWQRHFPVRNLMRGTRFQVAPHSPIGGRTASLSGSTGSSCSTGRTWRMREQNPRENLGQNLSDCRKNLETKNTDERRQRTWPTHKRKWEGEKFNVLRPRKLNIQTVQSQKRAIPRN